MSSDSAFSLNSRRLAASSLVHAPVNSPDGLDGLLLEVTDAADRELSSTLDSDAKVRQVFQYLIQHPGQPDASFSTVSLDEAEALVARFQQLGVSAEARAVSRCFYCTRGRFLEHNREEACPRFGQVGEVAVDLSQSEAYAIFFGSYGRNAVDSGTDSPAKTNQEAEYELVRGGKDPNVIAIASASGKLFDFHSVKLAELTSGEKAVREMAHNAPDHALEILQSVLYTGQATELLGQCENDQLNDLLSMGVSIGCEPFLTAVMTQKMALEGAVRDRKMSEVSRFVSNADYQAYTAARHCDGVLVSGAHRLPVHLFKLSSTPAGRMILEQPGRKPGELEVRLEHATSARALQFIAEYVYDQGVLVNKLEDSELKDVIMASDFLCDKELVSAVTNELLRRFQNYAQSDRNDRQSERALGLMQDVFACAQATGSKDLLSIAFKGAAILGADYHQALLEILVREEADGTFSRLIPAARTLMA